MSVRGQAFAMSGYPLSSSNMPGELLLRSFHWLIPLPGTSSFQYLQGEPRQVLQVIAPIRSQQDPSWQVYLKLISTLPFLWLHFLAVLLLSCPLRFSGIAAVPWMPDTAFPEAWPSNDWGHNSLSTHLNSLWSVQDANSSKCFCSCLPRFHGKKDWSKDRPWQKKPVCTVSKTIKLSLLMPPFFHLPSFSIFWCY